MYENYKKKAKKCQEIQQVNRGVWGTGGMGEDGFDTPESTLAAPPNLADFGPPPRLGHENGIKCDLHLHNMWTF